MNSAFRLNLRKKILGENSILVKEMQGKVPSAPLHEQEKPTYWKQVKAKPVVESLYGDWKWSAVQNSISDARPISLDAGESQDLTEQEPPTVEVKKTVHEIL